MRGKPHAIRIDQVTGPHSSGWTWAIYDQKGSILRQEEGAPEYSRRRAWKVADREFDKMTKEYYERLNFYNEKRLTGF